MLPAKYTKKVSIRAWSLALLASSLTNENQVVEALRFTLSLLNKLNATRMGQHLCTKSTSQIKKALIKFGLNRTLPPPVVKNCTCAHDYSVVPLQKFPVYELVQY